MAQLRTMTTTSRTGNANFMPTLVHANHRDCTQIQPMSAALLCVPHDDGAMNESGIEGALGQHSA